MDPQPGPSWYGRSQQFAAPPMQWQSPEMHYNQQQQQQQQPQQQQPPQQQQQPHLQNDYYAHQGYYAAQAGAPPPPPPLPPQQQQQVMIYGQPEQGWPASNGWSQQQWSYPGTTDSSHTQEEDWASKARAWAAAKAAQEAQQQVQLQTQQQSQPIQGAEQPYPEYLQQPPPPPRPPAEPPHQFSYQPPVQDLGTSAYGHDATSYNHEGSRNFGQESSSQFSQETSSGCREEEMKSLIQEGSGSGFAATVAAPFLPPLPPARSLAQVVSSSYSQDVSSNYGLDATTAVPPGTEQQEQLQPSPPPPPPPPPPPLATNQQPQALQLSPHQPTAHLQPHMPPPQFPYGDSALPPYDFHQHAQFDYQQPHSQDYQQQQPSQFVPNMGLEGPDMGFGRLPPSQGWPPQMPFPPSSMGPGMGGGPGLGPQFEFEHEHMHPGHHQHPQHLQGHTMFGRPSHGPGFRTSGPPLGQFDFGGSPIGPGAGMDFPMFMDNGNGHMAGPERPKKASVPTWLKEELLKKKSAVVAGGQATSLEDARPNGDESGASVRNKLELSERSRSDASRLSDTEDEDDEDDMEVARTAAMNQEIKRVLTEVLLKVTDDLFDEIAQEVMDEDEQRLLEDPDEKVVLVDAAETGGGWQKLLSPPPATSAPAAPAMILVAPLHQQRQDGSDNDSGSLSSGVPAGNLLGLATYASDDEDGGRSSRRLNETERFDGEVDDIEQEVKEASDVKDVGVETARVDTDVEEEREVGHWTDLKGKKRTNEDSNSSEHQKRSPRRVRHSETQGLGRETGPNTSALTESESTQGPKKTGIMESEHRVLKKDPQTVVPVKRLEIRVMETVATVEAAQEDKIYQTKALDDTGAKEHKHEPLNRGRSNEELINNLRVEKEEVTASQSKEERKDEQERLHGHHVEFHKKESGKVDDGDHDNNGSNKRETDKLRGKEDRGRASERSREKERIPIKEKNKDRVSDKLKERQRDKDKEEEKERVSRSRRRESDRDRRKSSSEKPGRTTTEKQKETRDIKKVHKKRSSSLNSRGRSRSHSRSRSASGSHSSSPSPTRSGTPKRGTQHAGRSSKQSRFSPAPVRSRRRRTSRSRSRSVPRRKLSHRRHSPSPSREKERHRRSRSASPIHKKRRS